MGIEGKVYCTKQGYHLVSPGKPMGDVVPRMMQEDGEEEPLEGYSSAHDTAQDTVANDSSGDGGAEKYALSKK